MIPTLDIISIDKKRFLDPLTTLIKIDDDVKIQFDEVSSLRTFLNSDVKIFYAPSSRYWSNNKFHFIPSKVIFKIVKIKKIMNTSIIANIEKTTLREMNLDKLI